jgi:hypothetical protein
MLIHGNLPLEQKILVSNTCCQYTQLHVEFEVRLQYVRSPDDRRYCPFKVVENPPVFANYSEYLRRVIVVVWRLVHVETRGGAQGLAVVPHFEELNPRMWKKTFS